MKRTCARSRVDRTCKPRQQGRRVPTWQPKNAAHLIAPRVRLNRRPDLLYANQSSHREPQPYTEAFGKHHAAAAASHPMPAFNRSRSLLLVVLDGSAHSTRHPILELPNGQWSVAGASLLSPRLAGRLHDAVLRPKRATTVWRGLGWHTVHRQVGRLAVQKPRCTAANG